MRFFVVGFLTLIMLLCAIHVLATTETIEGMYEKPEAPLGWTVVDKIAAHITDNDHEDVFIIMTDYTNDLIVWFEYVNESWKMVVLSSILTQKHSEYGVRAKDLRLFVKGKDILYGIEGSEAISIFKWDTEKHIFVENVPEPPDV